MKSQDFSLKNKKNFFECCLLQILLGTLRVKNKAYHIQIASFEGNMIKIPNLVLHAQLVSDFNISIL